jgi:hypothetical protein
VPDVRRMVERAGRVLSTPAGPDHEQPFSRKGHVMATADSTPRYLNVVGFPGYRVGDDGSVWRSWHGGWRLVPSRRHKKGYRRVTLHRDGKRYHPLVHRLVLEAFVGPCPKGMEVCHYPDTDKANNRLGNIRWDTHAENMRDAYRDRPSVTEKRCAKCGEVKPAARFYRSRKSTDGLKPRCKPCANQDNYDLWAKNPEKRRAYNREWMRRNGKRSG